MRSSIQLGLLVSIYACGALSASQWIMIVLTLFFIALNSYFHVKDKRELSKATYYIRPKMLRTFKELIKFILFVAIVAFGVYFLFRFLPEEKIKNASSFYYAIALLSMFWGNYYQTFKSSLRAFDFGITLPQKGGKKIDWKSIHSIEIEGNKLIMVYDENEKYTFDFDKRDVDDALKIKNQFLSKSS